MIIALYATKKDAESVCKKVENSVVLELTLVKTTAENYEGITDNDLYLWDTLKGLISLTAGLDKGTLTQAEALAKLKNYRDELLTKKDTLYDLDVPVETLDVAMMRTDCAFGCLDAITSETTAKNLAQKVRFAVATIAMSML